MDTRRLKVGEGVSNLVPLHQPARKSDSSSTFTLVLKLVNFILILEKFQGANIHFRNILYPHPSTMAVLHSMPIFMQPPKCFTWGDLVRNASLEASAIP